MTIARSLAIPAVLLSFGCNKTAYLGAGGEDGSYNYAFSTEIQAAEVAVQDCPDDLTIDWSGLTVDLLGHELDPADEIDLLRVVRFDDMGQDNVLAGISTNSLMGEDIDGALDFEPDGQQTNEPLTSFAFNGTTIDPSTEVCASTGTTFMVTALTGLYEYRMLTFFAPTEGESNTEVALDSNSADLSFEASMGASAIPLPANGPWMVDWLDMTVDGQGNPFSLANIDGLMLARYELTVQELEAQILDLHLIAAETYSADVGGMGSFDLAEAQDQDGGVFDGFDGEGIWLLGLFCGTCTNPAPIFLGMVEAG